jgi:hypothetical protein
VVNVAGSLKFPYLSLTSLPCTLRDADTDEENKSYITDPYDDSASEEEVRSKPFLGFRVQGLGTLRDADTDEENKSFTVDPYDDTASEEEVRCVLCFKGVLFSCLAEFITIRYRARTGYRSEYLWLIWGQYRGIWPEATGKKNTSSGSMYQPLACYHESPPCKNNYKGVVETL